MDGALLGDETNVGERAVEHGLAAIDQCHGTLGVALGGLAGLYEFARGDKFLLVFWKPQLGRQPGVIVFRPRDSGKHARGGDQQDDEEAAELMTEIPAADEGQKEQQEGDGGGNYDRADDLAVAGEVFEELKEEQVVPLGAGGRVLLGGVGGGAELRAAMFRWEFAVHEARQIEV